MLRVTWLKAPQLPLLDLNPILSASISSNIMEVGDAVMLLNFMNTLICLIFTKQCHNVVNHSLVCFFLPL